MHADANAKRGKPYINALRERGVAVLEVLNENQMLLDDDYLVESSEHIDFVPAVVEKRLGDPIIACDKPWEATQNFSCMLYEEESRTFRCWYTVFDGSGGDHGRSRSCYAESSDGVHFMKPSLGLHEFKGSRDNNIVWDNGHPMCVFKDFSEPDPQRRYKAMHDQDDHRGRGMRVAASPDGLHWTFAPYTVINGHEFDSQNVVFWDRQLGQYVAYIRFWLYGKRQIRRATSTDLYHWTEPVWVHGPDDDDPVESDLYTPAVCKYSEAPNVYVMQTSFFDHPSNMLWIQLALSRDGITWKRYRQPFIERGAPGTWDGGTHYALPGVFVHDDKLHVYYWGHSVGHVGFTPGGGIGMGTLRRDGFVALTAGATPGVITTKLLAFSHDGPATPNKGRLTINADAAGGSIAAELLDIEGKPIPGFTMADCDAVTSDSTFHVVTWQGKRALDRLMGVPIRVRFYLTRASLYAFRFLAYGTRTATLDDPEEKRLYDLDQINRNH